jgi:hypothetical protein
MLLQKGFNKGYYTVEMRLARAPDAIYDLYDEIFQAIMLEELPQLKSDYHKKLEAWERKNERIKLARANKAQTEQDRRKAKGVARPAKKPERDITTPPALKVSFGLFCFHSSGFTQLTWCFRCFPAVVVYILLGIHNLPCVERRCYPTYLCAICLHSSGFTSLPPVCFMVKILCMLCRNGCLHFVIPKKELVVARDAALNMFLRQLCCRSGWLCITLKRLVLN